MREISPQRCQRRKRDESKNTQSFLTFKFEILVRGLHGSQSKRKQTMTSLPRISPPVSTSPSLSGYFPLDLENSSSVPHSLQPPRSMSSSSSGYLPLELENSSSVPHSLQPPRLPEVADNSTDSSGDENAEISRLLLLANNATDNSTSTVEAASSFANSEENLVAGGGGEQNNMESGGTSSSSGGPSNLVAELNPGVGVGGGGEQNNMESGGTSSSSGGPSNLAAELNPEAPPNEAEDGNPGLAENVGAVIETEGFAENIVNDVEERVSWVSTQGNDFQEAKRKRRESGEGYVGTQQALVTDADASSCPICMEPWTSVGSHRISCLPCGHLFGWSCIRKWIRQGSKRIGKCPHCNRTCKLSEIRILYVARLAVADGEMQQELSLLRAENEKLKLENKNLVDERQQRKEEKAHFMDIKQLRMEKQNLLEEIRRLRGQRALLAATVPEHYGHPSGCQRTLFADVDERKEYHLLDREAYEPLSKKRHTLSYDLIHLGRLGSTSSSGLDRCGQPMFGLQAQSSLQGGRYFDIDSFTQMIIVSQKASDLGSVHFLTKMSLLSLSDGENICLPSGTGAVRDLHIAPTGTRGPGRLALVGSLGRKLSLVSFESNNVVVTYNLECPVWSCAWDINDPNRVYAGLQNGKLLIFDLRSTSAPINAIIGLNSKPVHSLHSVALSRSQNCEYGGRAVLGASCLGPSLWHVEDPLCRPHPFTGLENQGACISLAHCGVSDIAVASYRPFAASQVGFSACGSPSTEGTICSQFISPEGIADPSYLSRAPRMGSHFVLTKNSRNSQLADRMADQEFSASGNHNNGIGIEWNFNQEKVLHGAVSAVGMPKSTIVTLETGPVSRQPLFAYGDEINRAVSLWDVQSLSSICCLESHETPIIDVKHVKIGGQDILGCVSDKRLQIYAHLK